MPGVGREGRLGTQARRTAIQSISSTAPKLRPQKLSSTGRDQAGTPAEVFYLH